MLYIQMDKIFINVEKKDVDNIPKNIMTPKEFSTLTENFLRWEFPGMAL